MSSSVINMCLFCYRNVLVRKQRMRNLLCTLEADHVMPLSLSSSSCLDDSSDEKRISSIISRWKSSQICRRFEKYSYLPTSPSVLWNAKRSADRRHRFHACHANVNVEVLVGTRYIKDLFARLFSSYFLPLLAIVWFVLSSSRHSHVNNHVKQSIIPNS